MVRNYFYLNIKESNELIGKAIGNSLNLSSIEINVRGDKLFEEIKREIFDKFKNYDTNFKRVEHLAKMNDMIQKEEDIKVKRYVVGKILEMKISFPFYVDHSEIYKVERKDDDYNIESNNINFNNKKNKIKSDLSNIFFLFTNFFEIESDIREEEKKLFYARIYHIGFDQNNNLIKINYVSENKDEKIPVEIQKINVDERDDILFEILKS